MRLYLIKRLTYVLNTKRH